MGKTHLPHKKIVAQSHPLKNDIDGQVNYELDSEAETETERIGLIDD